MTAARDTIAAIVKAGLAPALKRAGFKKSAHTFRRTRGENVDVVQVQSGAGNFGADGRFVLNAGVYYRALRGGAAVEAPTEPQCAVRSRFGPATRGGDTLDGWWIVSASTDVGAAAADVVDVWNKRVSPWLDSVCDLRALHAMIESSDGSAGWLPDRLTPARVALACGDAGAAERRLHEVVTSIERQRAERAAELGGRDPFGTSVLKDATALAKRHGLKLASR